jgi:hypothetical protein
MEIPPAVVVWTFGNLPGNLTSVNNYQNNQGYSFKCEKNAKYLIWEKGQVSINLNFSDQPQTKVHFHLPDKSEREILTGEPISLGIGGGESFLYYGHQTFGINLKWSTDPKDEWRIFGADGVAGQKIPTGSPVALINTKVDPQADFMIPMDRHTPRVVDIGWTSSPDWVKDVTNKAISAAAVAAAALI